MAITFIRNRNTWAAYILISLYGYFLNILGPIAPFLHDEFQLSYTVTSLHSSAFAVGILVAGLAGDAVIRAVGRWQALAAGSLGLGMGALLLAAGRTPVLTVSACFLMGCVGSLILAVVPVALSEEHGPLRAVAIAEANVLASLVSAAAPFLVGWLAGTAAGWRLALVSAALLSILIGFTLFRAMRSRRTHPGTGHPQGGLPLTYWYFWFALVLAVSIEFCMVLWSAGYMERTLGMPKASAAQTVSLFLGGMILGRLAGSRIVKSYPARKVVLASLLLGLLGFVIYWRTNHAPVGMAGLALTGLGVASLYPMILTLAIEASGGKEGQAGARATLASGSAILLLPLALGRLADAVGLRAAYTLVLALFIILGGMMLLSARLIPDAPPDTFVH